MSDAERDKWDERYRGGAYEGRTHPTALLAAWLPFLPRGRPRNASCIRGTSAIPGGRPRNASCIRGTSAIPGRRALDVACGAGRNALYLAAAGFAVDALDISAVALDRGRRAAVERGLLVDWRPADFDRADFDERPERAVPPHYDLIVWVRYVNRALLPHLVARLNPGGHLICEQHLQTTADVSGPRSPDFRLRAGELREAARGMTVRHYNKGLIVDPDGRTVALTQLVARASPIGR
ncbi:MAG TPA: methyltransferase domain-containing protein [Gammaproteobacteria bacterium]|nr:methyltransferase domain-containing protein [Gammaproteobacteria bacterium]